MTDASGALLSETRYLPFGEVRDEVGTINQTDYGYTGQRNLDAQPTTYSLGLMDYKAQFYDSYNTQAFIQPDSIVPGVYNPQAFQEAFSDLLSLELEPGSLTENELERAGQLARQKYAHPSWTDNKKG